MTDLLDRVNSLLEAGETLARAVVVAREGSAPRSAGSRMLVRADGGPEGSVGGGPVEARVLEAAAEVLRGGMSRFLDFDLDDVLAAGAGMACGGRLRVFLERLEPGPDAAAFARLAALLREHPRALLLTPPDPAQGARAVLLPGEPASGVPAGVREEALRLGALPCPALLGGGWLLEPWTAPAPLFLVGAGHVSRPTAHLAALVGFRVTVLDDRPEFANRERFPEAHEIAVPEVLDTCLDGRLIGPQSSVVIVTRGHLHDRNVLARALRTPAGYVGMIGSRRKRETVFAQLRAEGFCEADLARVHCPVGLDIGAETPEEIAVSIVAELVRERAARGAG